MPVLGNRRKIAVRELLMPVSRPCQNGDDTDSATRCGMNMRAAFITWMRASLSAIPTWQCMP